MHLIVAEKQLAAQRIARILGGERKVSVKKENGVPVYSFDGTCVTGLKGHVVELDFPPEYAEWRSPKYGPRSLIDAPTLKKVTERRIVQLIQKLGREAKQVTIATDYDTEGELIGKEALELIREVNPSVDVRRARFSSITPQEIREAFAHAAELDLALAAAGEARQLIDLVWGASLTRFISIAARRGGTSILSVGRVQSPTLAMIVDREKEIESFVPEKYWMLFCHTMKDGIQFRAEHAKGRFREKSEAEEARARTQPPLRVVSVKEVERQEPPPPPFDTTSFIVAAAKLGFSAARAMQVAEDLYMAGYISYPRTDNTVYPPTLNLDALLGMLAHTELAGDAEWVGSNRRPIPARGKKQSTDHPPIHPTAPAKREELGEERFRIYELVARRFLATLCVDARWHTMRAQLTAGGEPYMVVGTRLVSEGWRRVYRFSEVRENPVPLLSEGEVLPIMKVALEEKETQPPPRYTQSRLIQRMEELGLGTKSTRHEVIQKLIARRYIFGNPLRPTLVARAVIEALEKHVDTITKPEMTRQLEEHMQQIKERKRTKEDVVLESRGILHRIFDELELHERDIGREILEKTAEEQTIGACPVCGGRLSIRSTQEKGQFIGCSGYPECGFNINLPPATWGRAVRTDRICRTHGLRHVQLVRKGKRPWELGCPICMQIETQRASLKLIPSMGDHLLERLLASHIYTVNEIASSSPEKIGRATGIPIAEAERIIGEATEVLGMLRRRSELKKFLRAHLAFRKGRSLTALMERFLSRGIQDLEGLAKAGVEGIEAAGLPEEEAMTLAHEAKKICGERLLRAIGIPAPSVKKYIAAGYTKMEELCSESAACLSLRTGLSLKTVAKHQEMVCRHFGRPPPVLTGEEERILKRLKATPSLSEEELRALVCAKAGDSKAPEESLLAGVAERTGIPQERLREIISSVHSSL